ncbi:unnamed protein product [Oncorhynchus mykiss]|uniref:Uncharacterized protein n=1 Tax=Oncorhynchus mykiss TaxID=8022 RepID=A0A060W494_ONCMY|nr:unnamed protein product [Oncorhynchus mykiss]
MRISSAGTGSPIFFPAGVGYSYSDDRKYKTDDDEVADDNYLALQKLWWDLCPNTQPAWTAKINFKAFAVGNGLSSYALNDQSLIYFGYYHGLFGEQLWTDLNTNCCDKVACNFFNNSKEACKTLVHMETLLQSDKYYTSNTKIGLICTGLT